MIYITGDCHNDFHRFNIENFPEQRNLTKDDYVIICGDFGGIWYNENNKYLKQEKYWLDWLNDRPFTILFIDGNHENFDRLNALPKKEWHGGLVHEIRPSLLHLCRGEVFEINGLKFFAFGGASSHDISDGILDKDDPQLKKKIRDLEEIGKYRYRIRNISWWEEELPTKEEMDNGIWNLEKHGNKVDYIITHSPAASVVALVGHGRYEQDILTHYLEKVRITTNYKKWFAGHLHTNKNVNDRDVLLYEQIIEIPTTKDYIKVFSEEIEKE